MFVYTHIDTHVYPCLDSGLHKFTLLFTYMFTHMFTHTFSYMFTHIYTHIYTHVYINDYTHVYTYLRTECTLMFIHVWYFKVCKVFTVFQGFKILQGLSFDSVVHWQIVE